MNTVRRAGAALRPGRLLIAGLLVVMLGGGAYLIFGRAPNEAGRRNYSLVTVERGPIRATVNASGVLQPARIAELNFGGPGVVAEIMVAPGDEVPAGEPLARLDTRGLELELERAEAALFQAQASYNQLAGSVTDADIAQAQAQVDQAEGQYAQAQGQATASDIAAARAQLEQARAALAQLLSGPKSDDVRVAELRLEEARQHLAQLEAGADPNAVVAAQAALDSAKANLDAQRHNLSAAKVNAENQMHIAANVVRDAQAEYSRISWNIKEREAAGQEVPQWMKDREAQALRAVESAQLTLEQARVQYEQARQAEIDGIAAAESQVRSAEANLETVRAGPSPAQVAAARSQLGQAEANLAALLAGAEPDQVAAARAQVAQAEANLAALQDQTVSGSIAVAEAGLRGAQANLERVAGGPSKEQLDVAMAQVRQADIALKQAQLALESATIVAPFAGTVGEINVLEGGTPAVGQPALTLVDLTQLRVAVTVDEIDVAQIALNQLVTVSVDALPDQLFSGFVATISPVAATQSGVSSYKVWVDVADVGAQVRPGMSANVEITVAERPDTLLLPLRAVRYEGSELVVDVVEDQSLCAASPDSLPLTPPALRPQPVRLGLSNDELTEVLPESIAPGTCVLVEGFDARLSLMQGTPMPSFRERRQGR